MKTIIIGAGPAGVTVAETLCQHNMEGDITLVSSEPFPPYSPPAMIEYYMTGQDAHLWRWGDIQKKRSYCYKPSVQVTKIQPEKHEIRLSTGEILFYDNCVIATGSQLYAPLEGSQMKGIYNFKSLSSANELMGKITTGAAKSALIVGAGFIGIEIALLLCYHKVKVTILDMAEQVMPAMLDKETAEIVVGLLRERGISVRLNTKAMAFRGDSQVEGVKLDTGDTLKADIIIAATGVKPNVSFLKGSGIELNRGILTDEYCRTSVPHIYAAGDVAETPHRITGERAVYPLFPNAVSQGRTVASTLLGRDEPYEGAERMNSLKHLGLPIIAAGHMKGEALRMNRNNTMRTIYIQNNRIVGFQLAGDIRGAGIYRTLMNKKIDVSHFQADLLTISSLPKRLFSFPNQAYSLA
ncbi:MAG: NAD(P)/FAD-dependent oxidoreductase [bacterium]